jgi:chromosome segregation protein
VLDFDSKDAQNVTAVVGPNGSGKSNVADAIRWVTGEQSSKNLRSKKSEDIIFCGTAGKSRGSYAEVTLILASDKPVKFELNNKEHELLEIEVARKIYRSGESEYLINRKKVRLIDIQQLMASLGFGQSSYTVIGQGMVDRLLFFTPSERKVLFDEAAGVKQYEIKREQSLRKLEQTDGNLIRLKDILVELEPRVVNLRRLVKRAEGRKEIEIEVKDLETKLFASLLAEYSDIANRADENKQNITNKITEIEKRIISLDEESQKTRNNPFKEERISLEAQLSQLRGEENKLRQEVAFINGQIESAKQNMLLVENRKVSAQNETKDLEDKISFLDTKIREEDVKLVQIRADLAKIEPKELDILVEIEKLNKNEGDVNTGALEKKLSSLHLEIESLGNQRNEIYGKLYALKQNEQAIESRNQETEGRKKRLLENISTLKARHESVNKSLDINKAEYTKNNNELVIIIKNKEQIIEKLSKKEAEVGLLSQKISKESLVELSSNLASVRKIHGELLVEVENVDSATSIAELKKSFKTYAGITDNLFGSFEIVTKALDADTRQKLDSELREIRLELSRANEDISSLQISKAKIESEKRNLDNESERIKEELVSLNVELESFGGIEKASDTKDLEADFGRQISELTTKINSKTLEEQKTVEEISSLKSKKLEQKNQLFSELSEVRSQKHAIEIEVARISSIILNQKSELEGTIRRLDELSAMKFEAQNGDDELEKSLNSKAKTLDKLEMDIAKIRGSIQDATQKEKDFEQKFYTINKDKSNLNDEKNQLIQKISSLEVEEAKNSVRLEDLQEEIRLSGLEINFDAKTQILDQMEKDVAKLKIENIKRKLTTIGSVDPETEAEYHDLEARTTEMSTQVEDLSKAKDDLEKVVKELDERIKNQFSKAFKNIGSEFERYFKMLFNGGEASLNLGEDEEGNYGIEIKANPPGKRLTSLNVLSGGERTLTSLALLFAILSINPSPFVVLDEVDAALDESNTLRFLDILDDLAKKTQFIIITHNRDTMKSASNLYGVTMNDEHVSKLLSIRLTEALVAAK